MANKYLVSINCSGDAATPDQVFRALEVLGTAIRMQHSVVWLETNVTARGINSYVRGMLGEHDSVLVAEAIKIIS